MNARFKMIDKLLDDECTCDNIHCQCGGNCESPACAEVNGDRMCLECAKDHNETYEGLDIEWDDNPMYPLSHKDSTVVDSKGDVVWNCRSWQTARRYAQILNRAYAEGKSMYKSFPIVIPDFMNTPEWRDTSWGNDVTASSEWYTPLGMEFIYIRVWVYSDIKSDRDPYTSYKYAIQVLESDGNEISQYETNNIRYLEEEFIFQRDSIMILYNNRVNAE